ncbi:MAG: hypothetical protein AAF847_08120 [Bacteroidota bacterium]
MTALLLLLFVFAGLLFAGIGIKLLRNLFLNWNPSDSKIQEDIRQMRAEIEPFAADLVPLDSKELELFSLNQLNQTLSKSMTTTAKGVYTSIYQEPLVAYSYKKYFGENALLYARTATREIVYRISKKGIKVAINQNYYGTIKQGVLYGRDTKKALAQVNARTPELMLPVIVGEKEVGLLNAPNVADTPQPRAFRYVSNELNEAEEQAFLTLAILELVQKQVEE